MSRPAIVVHGGAGARAADDSEPLSQEGCLAAARAGFVILARGGHALDAVEAAVTALEDNPLFNAGTGATLTSEGGVELDAAIMNGRTLAAGAVGALRRFKNPIRIARAVMERSPHVLLVSEGAERFAEQHGFRRCEEAQLITDKARARHAREKSRREASPEGGTVGAVAVDQQGHVAAATSTGGMLFKLPGRVGDTPLIGAGTYADDLAGAVSATGHGEIILRLSLGHFAAQRMRAGRSPQQALEETLAEAQRLQGEVGLIAVSPAGELGMAFSSDRMARAWVTAETEGAGFLP